MQLENRKILLVEDCPDQQRLLLNFLKYSGAEVVLECDGFAAIRNVKKAMRDHSAFDAVIMDLVLEESDGIESTESILTLDPHIAIVAITANGTPEIEDRWRRAGALDYLEKPLSKNSLIDAVYKAITLVEINKTCV